MTSTFRQSAMAIALAVAIASISVSAQDVPAPAIAPPSPALESFVPGDYDVTVRVDLRQLFDSVDLEPLRMLLMQPKAQQICDMIDQWVGIDLRSDVDTIVLAAYVDNSRKDEAAFLLRGRLDKTRVLDGLRMGAQFEEAPVSGHVIYGWWDQNKQQMNHIMFLADDTLAVGDRQVLETIATGTASPGGRLVDKAAYSDCLRRVPPRNLASVVAVLPELLPFGEENNLALKVVRAGVATLVVDERVEVSVGLVLLDEELATLTMEMAEGLQALAQLPKRFPDQKGFDKVQQAVPFLDQLARRIGVTTEGAELLMRLSVTKEEVAGMWRMAPNTGFIAKLKQGGL